MDRRWLVTKQQYEIDAETILESRIDETHRQYGQRRSRHNVENIVLVCQNGRH